MQLDKYDHFLALLRTKTNSKRKMLCFLAEERNAISYPNTPIA